MEPLIVDLDTLAGDVIGHVPGNTWVLARVDGTPLGVVELEAGRQPVPASVHDIAFAAPFGSLAARERLRAQHLSPDPVPELRTSVLVCTRDRPEALDRCLLSVAKSTHPVDEVVVVDNGSASTDTRQVAMRHEVTYVHEPVPGLDRARNRGFAVASGDVVLCTDDDAEVDPDWAVELLRAFADPLVAVATGLVVPARLDSEAQLLFERYCGFSRGNQRRIVDGAYVTPYAAGSVGAGASMALRRDFVLAVGGFPEELDAGMPTCSGGDTFMIGEVLRHGYRAAYVPRALAHHTHRESMEALYEAVRGYGTGTVSWMLAAAARHRDVGALTVGLTGYAQWLRPRLLRAVLGVGDLPRSLALADVRGAAEALWRLPKARVRASRHRPVLSSEATTAQLPRPAGPVVRADGAAEFAPLSVVIPSRGRRDKVVRLLSELERCRFDDRRVEYVVALDGELDDSRSAVEAMALRRDLTVRVLRAPGSDPHLGNGAGVARNVGAQIATNPVLLFLDDDVTPSDDGLLAHHAALHPIHGQCAAVGACWPRTPARPHRVAAGATSWWVDQARRMRSGQRLLFNQFNTGNASVGRSSFLSVGGFEALPRSEDWAFGLQYLAAGLPIYGLPEASVHHDVVDDPHDSIGDRRREGAGDVALVRQHPAALPWMRCGGLDLLDRRWRQVARMALERHWTSSRMLELLQTSLPVWPTLGLVRREVQATGLAYLIAYWEGVGEAVGGMRGLRALQRTAAAACRETVVWNLDQPLPPLWVGMAPEVTIQINGVPLGRAHVQWGGVPFDEDAFKARVIDAFARDVAVSEMTVVARSGGTDRRWQRLDDRQPVGDGVVG